MTVTTIHGLPDLSDPTPDTDITLLIPLDAWKAATSWITGSKPGGKDHPMDQLYIRFTDHPHHYTEQWDREPVDGQPAVTLQTTDKYRMSWATISDLGDPEDDNRLTYIKGEDIPGAVSVDATVALKAMRGWPPIDKEQVGVHAVQLHWDHTDRLVTLTLTNVETSTDLAQSFLPLFDGLHDFPRFPPYAHEDQLPHPVGVFGVSQWAHAVQVSAENLLTVAAWCGGHTWANAVVVPLRHITPIPGEASAAVGDWVLALPDGTFEVCAERDFERQWTQSVGAR